MSRHKLGEVFDQFTEDLEFQLSLEPFDTKSTDSKFQLGDVCFFGFLLKAI